MSRISIRITTAYCLFGLTAILAFRKHYSLELRAHNTEMVKQYASQLVKDNSGDEKRFFSENFVAAFEKQVIHDPTQVDILNSFKSDSSYPINLFAHIMNQLHNKPARQFSVPFEKDSHIHNTVNVFSSHKFCFEFRFIKRNNSLIMDSVSNVSEYFSYLKCLKEQKVNH